ncbi:glycosyltransferase family 2 protein [Cellulosimicrobium terreum]|nr:glycosyltransferase family 2 protein [Cellulosimicrobium terreum]
MTSSDLQSTARTVPTAPGTRPVPDPALRPARTGSVPDVVAAVTGAVPVLTTVVAVVVTRGATAYLSRTLEAVRAQSSAPDHLVVVDVAADGSTGRYDDLHLGDARFIAAPRARSFGEAVDAALAGHERATWLWLLHDDAAPAPDALENLLRAVEHSSAVAIAGAKQERWIPGRGPRPADPFAPGAAGRLVEVGYTTTPLGRRMTGIDDDEIDQGQHDAREDVLAVGLVGALVRRTVWDDLGGPDPELGPYGDGLDLARRARLAGHRVVVVPSAVVRHVQASLLGLRDRPLSAPDADSSYGARRRAHLHARLTGVAVLLVPVVAVAMVLAAPFHAMYRLLVKQPGQARDELLSPLWVLLRVGPVARARRAARRTRRLPRRTLRPLRGTWRAVLAERRDHRLARAELRRTAWAPTDIERAELRALALRRRAALVGVALALTALTALVFGPLLGVLLADGRLVGGELLPATSTLGDVWRAATTGWVSTGLGAPAPADPFVSVLVPATLLAGGATQTAINVLVPACFVAAGLGAWFAAGTLTRSVPLRLWATLVWVAAPALLAAVGSGRVGAVLVHAALPWLALTVVRALGMQRLDVVAPPVPEPSAGPARPVRREPGSLAAAAAAGLLLVVVVAGAPVLLPAVVLALGVVAVGVRGHRRYLGLVPVPAVVVFAPFLVHVVRTWTDGGWRLLLADPGAPVASAAGPPWQQLLGLPVEPAPWFGLDGGGTLDLLAAWAPFVAGGSVVVLAVVGALRGRGGAVGAWFVAAVGLVVAMLAGATTVAPGLEAGAPVAGWPGAGVSLTLLALLAAALLGMPRLPEGAPAWRTGTVAALAVVVVVLPLGSLASWTTDALDRDGASVGALVADPDPVVPPVGRQIQTSPRQARVLAIEPGTRVGYALLRSDGPQAVDSSVVVHGLQTQDPAVTQGPVPELVAELVAGTSDDAAARLADLGVGAVLLPASVPDDGVRAELVARLDMTPGLERMTEGQDSLMWRVAPDGAEPAWARVVVGDDVEPLDADRTALRAVDVRIPAGADDRVVELAEDASSGWRATLGGRPLEAVDPQTTDGLQAFRLGADAGRLEVFHATDHRSAWMAVTGVVLLVYVLLAVPVRRRRAGAR